MKDNNLLLRAEHDKSKIIEEWSKWPVGIFTCTLETNFESIGVKIKSEILLPLVGTLMRS